MTCPQAPVVMVTQYKIKSLFISSIRKHYGQSCLLKLKALVNLFIANVLPIVLIYLHLVHIKLTYLLVFTRNDFSSVLFLNMTFLSIYIVLSPLVRILMVQDPARPCNIFFSVVY